MLLAPSQIRRGASILSQYPPVLKKNIYSDLFPQALSSFHTSKKGKHVPGLIHDNRANKQFLLPQNLLMPMAVNEMILTM